MKRGHFFGADEEAGEFGFSGIRHEELNDLCHGEDGSVVIRDRFVFG